MPIDTILTEGSLDNNLPLDEIKSKVQAEADLIVTAMLLGFIATRHYQNQICRFDFESPSEKKRAIQKQLDSHQKEELTRELFEKRRREGSVLTWDSTHQTLATQDVQKLEADYLEQLREVQDFEVALDTLSAVLDKFEPGMGASLKDGQSPDGKEGALITGKKGGEMATPENRATPVRMSKLRMLRNAKKEIGQIYQGRGAYTGLVEDPIQENTNVYPTMRVKVEGLWPGLPNAEYWGLIQAKDKDKRLFNLMDNPKLGMGPIHLQVDESAKETKVGYVHGMCTAIHDCVKSGPWTTPYEMATGQVTTKMASCFPCTTYMYSAGFPPSSIHLGRGESWVPPRDGRRLEKNANNETNCDHTICNNLSLRWHRDVHKQLTLGVKVLQASPHNLSATHRPLLTVLDNKLTPMDDDAINNRGGDLFLSALTMHDNEVNKIKRTLEPAFEDQYLLTNYITDNGL